MIIISDYQPDWPAEFTAIAAELTAVLGPLASRVDHIGSTSVPGLAAKDIIDIQVTVAALTDEIEDQLVAAGFVLNSHRSDHVPLGEDPNPALWEKRLFNERPGQRRANIHVRMAGNPNQRYPLLFRDYLRAHPKAAETVALVKQELVRYHADDVQAYYAIKDPVYDLIWNAAQAWSAETGPTT